MDKRIDAWLQDIDAVTDQVRSLTAGLSPIDIGWQPATGAWSVSLILDHLVKVNDSYGPAVSELRSSSFRLPVIARIPGLPGLLGAMILRTVAPESRRRVRTFPVWEPQCDPEPVLHVSQFIRSQDVLKSLIAGSADLLRKGAILCSPANRMIVYPLSTAFDILVRHEERHLAQIIRTIEQRHGAS